MKENKSTEDYSCKQCDLYRFCNPSPWIDTRNKVKNCREFKINGKYIDLKKE